MSIFESRVQFGQTWRNEKRKRKKDRLVEILNSIAGMYIYLFNVTQNIGICVYIGDVVSLFRTRLIRKLWSILRFERVMFDCAAIH